MSILKTVISEGAVKEFSDSVNVKKGEIANHGMLGNVKVLYIHDTVAEVSDRHGKHFKVQLSSLRPGAMTDESVNENYDKHSAAANNYDHEIENGATDRATYKDAAKHHERAAKTAPSDSLKKVHEKKAADYLEKARTTNEATQDERKETRTRALIADYEKRASATKNDIKKQHYMDMARKLREELPVSEGTVKEFSRDLAARYVAKANQERDAETKKMHASGKYDQNVVDKAERRAAATMKLKNKFISGTKKEGIETMEQKSVLSEALEQINEWGIGAERHADAEWHPATARGMASNRTGKYCLTRDNPPVRGRGFLCFGSEGDAVFAWKRLSNNTGVKIVRESAFHDDGTPLKEGEVLLVDTSSIMLDEAVGDRYADQLAAKLPPGLTNEQDILDQAFVIAKQELGLKKAQYYFAYDQDFSSDMIDAYFYNQQDTGMQEAAGEKKSAPAPRNFVAKHAKMGGAGEHKDKKRAAKQGDVKHKGKLEESEDGYAKVEKAIAQHKRTLKNKLATPANVAYAQKMIARGNAALKKSTGEEAYKHFQGSVKESVIDDLLALSEKL